MHVTNVPLVTKVPYFRHKSSRFSLQKCPFLWPPLSLSLKKWNIEKRSKREQKQFHARKKESLPGVLGNKGTLEKYLREQGNMSLFLRNRGIKLYKLEVANIVSKFITRGTNTENVREHGNIGQFWKGTRIPPGRPSKRTRKNSPKEKTKEKCYAPAKRFLHQQWAN